MSKSGYLFGIDDEIEPSIEQYADVLKRFHKDSIEIYPYLRIIVLFLFILGLFNLVFAPVEAYDEKIPSAVSSVIEGVIFIWISLKANEVLKVVKILSTKSYPSIPRLMEYSGAIIDTVKVVAIGFLSILFITIILSVSFK